MGLIACRQKMFGNSGGFGFNVSFVDRASMFIESVFDKQIYIFPLSYLIKIITLLTLWFWIPGNDDVTCNPRLREKMSYSSCRVTQHDFLEQSDTIF